MTTSHQAGLTLTASLGILAATNIFVLVATQWYIVSTLGATRETDALFAGMAVPQVILMVVSGSLGSVVLPLFATADPATARRDAWGLTIAASAVLAVVVAILEISAAYWVPVLVPGFSASAQRLTVSLTRIQLVTLVLVAATGVLSAFAQASGRFIRAEMAALVGACCGLAVVVIFLRRYGVFVAASAVVLRALIQCLWLLPLLGRWRGPDWRSPALIQACKRTRPLLVGATYYKVDTLVDRFLASMTPAGGLSLLTIGQHVFSAGAQVISRAAVVPVAPRLADEASRGSWHNFRDTYRRRFIAIGSTASLALLVPLVPRGAGSRLGAVGLSSSDADLLLAIATALLGMFIGGCLGQVTSTAFYAMGDTKTPTRLGVLLFTLYLPVKCLAFFWYGLIGMAGSISGYYAVSAIVQVIALERILRRRAAEKGVDGVLVSTRA